MLSNATGLRTGNAYKLCREDEGNMRIPEEIYRDVNIINILLLFIYKSIYYNIHYFMFDNISSLALIIDILYFIFKCWEMINERHDIGKY